MSWQFNNTEPVFLQIVHRLRNGILQGKYPPGEQFPTVRQLASEAGVNPNTMQKALTVLEEESLLCGKGTVGRFVTEDRSALSAAADVARRKAVRKWLSEASALGISAAQLIDYIQKEEEKG